MEQSAGKAGLAFPRRWITCEGFSFKCEGRHKVGCLVRATVILRFDLLVYFSLFLRHLVSPLTATDK